MATDKETYSATREATRDATARAKGTVEEMTRTGEATTRRAADAARSFTDDVAQTGRMAAEDGAETSRKVMDAGTDMGRRGAETARDLMGTASDVAGRTSQQFQKAFGLSREAQGEVASQARETMDVMVQCGSVLADGWQSAWREWMGLAQEVATRNAEGVNDLMRSRTVPDFYAAQSRMLKENVQLMLDRSVRISEMSARTADAAVRKLGARVEDAAQQADRRL